MSKYICAKVGQTNEYFDGKDYYTRIFKDLDKDLIKTSKDFFIIHILTIKDKTFAPPTLLQCCVQFYLIFKKYLYAGITITV